MEGLSEVVVYLWLLPVVAQIVVPLGMLGVHLVKRMLSGVFRREPIAFDKLAGVPGN